MAALLLRRAFRSSLAPLASRSPPPSSYRLLSFSTCQIPDKSPEDSYRSTVKKIVTEVASSSSGRLPLPSGYPFDFDIDMHGNVASLLKSHGTEEMVNVIIYGNDPPISMDVKIRTWKVEVSAKITPKPDQLHIHEINACHLDENMGDYKDYLETKGLTPMTIRFLYGLLGCIEART